MVGKFCLYAMLWLISICMLFMSCSPAQVQGTLNAPAFKVQLYDTRNAVLLDVRTPEEYAEGHIPSAINLDVDADDFEYQVAKLDSTKTYFLYCGSGSRSKEAYQQMVAKGFSEVFDLIGGLDAWTAEGYPVESLKE